MANAALTQEQIDAFVALLSTHAFLCKYGSSTTIVNLGPLASAPKVEADTATKDVMLYETGPDDPVATYLTKNRVKVTIETHNVDAAMALLNHKVGDNILAAAGRKPLVLVPLTDEATAKGLTFPAASVQPGLAFDPQEEGTPHKVTLTFLCYPDDTTGLPWTWGVIS